jgi:hypothetical protein
MEMQTATSSASWLQVQLLKMTMVTGLLPMGNGNADWNNSGSAAGHQLLVTMVAGLQPRAMENAEGSRVPAARDAGRAPCLLPSDAGEGWQWSQWKGQQFPKRYTVSFEGRSLPHLFISSII